MKILLLSAYDAESHQRWYDTLMAAFSSEAYQWTILTLPPRYFNWRIRGNSLSWAFGEYEQLSQSYDLLIATSMVDLASLRGFIPSLSAIPTLVYFHENQFAYPPGQQPQTVEPQILNLYTALAADWLVFNSAYNRVTFLQGAKNLLAKLPDHVPKGLPERLIDRSEVLPVPLPDKAYMSRSPKVKSAALQVLWNHRWEYDKAPERLLTALKQFEPQGLALDLHIVGQRFRQIPPVFNEMKAYIDSTAHFRLLHWGYVEDESAYQQLLQTADVVVSTAIHDFQGLAVLETVAAGCIPLVPKRLCYNEWFADDYLYRCDEHSPAVEAHALAERLQQFAAANQAGLLAQAPKVEGLSMSVLHTRYLEVFEKTIDMHKLAVC